MKNTLQLKFSNSVEFACVLVGTLKTGVNTKYYSSVVELISKFPLPKLVFT
jgi:hypothetical protein